MYDALTAPLFVCFPSGCSFLRLCFLCSCSLIPLLLPSCPVSICLLLSLLVIFCLPFSLYLLLLGFLLFRASVFLLRVSVPRFPLFVPLVFSVLFFPVRSPVPFLYSVSLKTSIHPQNLSPQSFPHLYSLSVLFPCFRAPPPPPSFLTRKSRPPQNSPQSHVREEEDIQCRSKTGLYWFVLFFKKLCMKQRCFTHNVTFHLNEKWCQNITFSD